MDKWVIKKGMSGKLEVWKYIDDISEARRYWYVSKAIDKYGLSKVLPLAMNDVGGYHWLGPDIKSGNIVKIIESNSKPELSLEEEFGKNEKHFSCGWLSPECDSYSCGYMEHIDLADKICKDLYDKHFCVCDDFLLDNGWIKVTRDGWYGNWDKINDDQINFLESKNIKYIIEDSAGNFVKEMKDSLKRKNSNG